MKWLRKLLKGYDDRDVESLKKKLRDARPGATIQATGREIRAFRAGELNK